MTILVTGGCGFIGSNFILDWMTRGLGDVVNVDKLTYAGNPTNLAGLAGNSGYRFVHAGIEDGTVILDLLRRHEVSAVVNFAAESHVDRSILGPEIFVQTNVLGTLRLLQAAHAYWRDLEWGRRERFRFLHVSTDEVYGSLLPDDAPFKETSPFRPNSPYAASKAASDHLVRAWYETYRLPTLTTNCSNNYGPYQLPEKLIPLMIARALEGETLPIYGDGGHVRDWLYIADHCSALRAVLSAGVPGETYNVGANCERRNIDIVRALCAILDVERPRTDGRSYAEQIAFVADRPGHDRRYAIDNSKITRELGWAPGETLEGGLLKTVQWYLSNPTWVEGATGSRMHFRR
jgi:dTDP-glucose 4,6-dehydratase